MSFKFAIVAVIVVLIAGLSLFEFVNKRTRSTLVQLCGCGLLLVMVLTHVAEQFRLLPEMGWGRADTPGALRGSGECDWRIRAVLGRPDREPGRPIATGASPRKTLR